MSIDFPLQNGTQLKTMDFDGSNAQMWMWAGDSLLSKSGIYLGQIVDSKIGPVAVALDTRGADMMETKWKMEDEKIISLLNGNCVDIKDGSVEANKDIVLTPATNSEGVSSQSWRLVEKN